MLWTRSVSAWRTPENVWLRSAGTSVRSPLAGFGLRPSATRASWTSARACLTWASATRWASRRWSILLATDRAPAEELLGAGEVGPGPILARLPAPQGGDLGAEQGDGVVDVLDRLLELPPLAAGLGQDAPHLGLRGGQVGFGGGHGRLLDVDLDLVRLPVELDQQVALPHPVVVLDQDAGHLAR